jgi:hypothetical protein
MCTMWFHYQVAKLRRLLNREQHDERSVAMKIIRVIPIAIGTGDNKKILHYPFQP